MCVSSHLLKLCEEFFEEISPEELERAAADEVIEELREFLTDQIESGSDGNEEEVIETAKTRLALLWSHIGKIEKSRNPSLATHYSELQEHLDYLFEENSALDAASSWKDEYLVDNAGDDFYEDSDEFDADGDETSEDLC